MAHSKLEMRKVSGSRLDGNVIQTAILLFYGQTFQLCYHEQCKMLETKCVWVPPCGLDSNVILTAILFVTNSVQFIAPL